MQRTFENSSLVAEHQACDHRADHDSTEAVAPLPWSADVRLNWQVTVACRPGQVYRFCRDLTNWPRFVEHLAAATAVDDRRFSWILQIPEGDTRVLDLEIIGDQENRLIAWCSMPGADVDHVGLVRLSPTANGKATRVQVWIGYNPHSGLGSRVAPSKFAKMAEHQIEDDLRRFKQVVETEALVSGPS